MDNVLHCPTCLSGIDINLKDKQGECKYDLCPHKIKYLIFDNLEDLIKSRNETNSWFPKIIFEKIINDTSVYGYFYSDDPVDKYLVKKGNPFKSLFEEEFLHVWIEGIKDIGMPFFLYSISYKEDHSFLNFEKIDVGLACNNSEECSLCKETSSDDLCIQILNTFLRKINELGNKEDGLSSIKNTLKSHRSKETRNSDKVRHIFDYLQQKCEFEITTYGIPIIIHDVLIGIAILRIKVGQNENESNELVLNHAVDSKPHSDMTVFGHWNRLVDILMRISDVGEQIYLMRRLARDNLFREELINRFEKVAKGDISNFDSFLNNIMNECFSRICEYTLFENIYIFRREPNDTFSLLKSFPVLSFEPSLAGVDFNIHEEKFISSDSNLHERSILNKIQNVLKTNLNNLYVFTIYDENDYKLFIYTNRQYSSDQPLNRISSKSRSFIRSVTSSLDIECQRIKDHHVREEFLRDIAHNFRTPLSLLNAEITELNIKVETAAIQYNDLKEFIKNIDDIESLLEFETKRFLTTYKFLTTKDLKKSCTADISLTQIVEEAIDSFRIIANPSNIILRPPQGKVGKIKSNEEYINLIVYILFDNAVKYSTDNSFIDTSIYTKTMGDKRGYEFSISNFGIGIDESERKAIFSVGKRGRWATVYKPQAGTGRGLAILKTILEALGGTILAVESHFGKEINVVPGTGYKTTFKIWFPVNAFADRGN